MKSNNVQNVLKYKNDVSVILAFNNYFKSTKLENIHNNFKIFRKESFRLEKEGWLDTFHGS